MASTSNFFAILDSTGTDSPLEPITPPSKNRSITCPGAPRKEQIKWADVEDDPIDDFSSEDREKFEEMEKRRGEEESPSQNKVEDTKGERPVKIDMTDEEKKAWRLFDIHLAKKREIEVVHNVRVYNKETREANTIKNTRKFKIISKSMYDGFRKIIEKYRTHKDGRVNYRDQAEKIKMANNLMEFAYKDPKVPCCFVYPVVIINIESGKTLTRNEINKGSKCFFDVSDISYYPPFN